MNEKSDNVDIWINHFQLTYLYYVILGMYSEIPQANLVSDLKSLPKTSWTTSVLLWSKQKISSFWR